MTVTRILPFGLGAGLSGLSGFVWSESMAFSQETISHVVLAAAGKFDISSIPGTYDTLILDILRTRTDRPVVLDSYALFLNGDTTAANYRTSIHRSGSNTTLTTIHSVNNNNNSGFANLPGASATSDYFAVGKLIIPNYTDDKFKVIYSEIASRYDANGMELNISITHWENVAVINRIQLEPFSGDDFVADSEIALYGIKY